MFYCDEHIILYFTTLTVSQTKYFEWVVRLVNRELERKLPWPSRGTVSSTLYQDSWYPGKIFELSAPRMQAQSSTATST
jgi:hypothetical protein